MGKYIKIMILCLCVSLIGINCVRGGETQVDSGIGDVDDATGSCGCYPARGEAGINTGLPIMRITLVDKYGNRVDGTKTVDFLFSDMSGNPMSIKASNKSIRDSLIETLVDIFNARMVEHPGFAPGDKYRSDDDYARRDFYAFQTYRKETYNENQILKMTTSGSGLDKLNVSNNYIRINADNSAVTTVYKKFIEDINNEEGYIISQIINVIIPNLKENSSDINIDNNNYLLLEPVYIWSRGDMYWSNEYEPEDFCEREVEKRLRQCRYAGEAFVYGTAKEIISWEKEYSLKYKIVQNNEAAFLSTIIKGALISYEAKHLWKNDVYLYDTLFGLYVSNAEINEKNSFKDFFSNSGSGIIAVEKTYSDTLNGKGKITASKQGKAYGDYLKDMFYTGHDYDIEKRAYGMGLVSFKDMKWCELQSDNGKLDDWQAITKSNFHLDNESDNLSSSYGDKYCCNLISYLNKKAVVNINGKLEELKESELYKTSFYQKYCSGVIKGNCQYIEGKYYDKNGNVVTKEVFDKVCPGVDPEDYKCRYVSGKYYDKEGNVVTKETFDKVCKVTQLPVIYRTISLDNPFLYKNGDVRPLSKLSNWYNQTKPPVTVGNYREDIINNSKTAYTNNTPKYTINLNVSSIKKIREFNKGNIYSKESNCSFLCKEGSSIGIDINTVKSMGCSC